MNEIYSMPTSRASSQLLHFVVAICSSYKIVLVTMQVMFLLVVVY